MGNFYAFNKTVKGYLHDKKNIPCEDFSGSCSDEKGRFHIAVVADGHGDTACMRSAAGSRKAVEIAKECLAQFAEDVMEGQASEGCRSIGEQLAIGRHGGTVMRQLAASIVSRWHSFAAKDIVDNPLSPQEMDKAERFADLYRNGERLEHVYGTTLIAALMLPDYLILIQQGDGRCDVFYEDGTVDQPIPWDDRCHENVTTSMCDEDVAASIRSCVINFKDKKMTAYSTRLYAEGYCETELGDRKVMACYLGSDGIEDSYRNMEGTHTFYRQLTCDLHEKGKDGIEAHLEDTLPGFSRQGSGDDVSVGGIVDMDKIGDCVQMFREQVRQYTLEEAVVQHENRAISMSRKHEILRRRRDEAEQACREKQQRSDAEQSRLKRLCAEVKSLERIWSDQNEKVQQQALEAEKAQSEFEKAQSEFQEYDEEYRAVQDQIKRIRGEINDLKKSGQETVKADFMQFLRTNGAENKQ